MPDEASGQPKIIIDEDWKSQVQAEKEALARQQSATQPSTGQPPAGRERSGPLPAASLTVLVSMLASQATVALGAIPNPITGKTEADLEEARHLIDLLQVLEDKTQGNRTPQETALMSRLLDELRLGFIAVQRQTPAQSEAKT